MLNATVGGTISGRAYSSVYRRGKSPYINKETGTWYIFNDATQLYEDSGMDVYPDIEYDKELSEESENAVLNKVITRELLTKVGEDNVLSVTALDIDVLWELI